MPEYDALKESVWELLANYERGNPHATAAAILAVVDAPQPPLRLFLGKNNLEGIRQTYSERIKVWEEWQDVAAAAQGN